VTWLVQPASTRVIPIKLTEVTLQAVTFPEVTLTSVTLLEVILPEVTTAIDITINNITRSDNYCQ
jgi:hypothetical protein